MLKSTPEWEAWQREQIRKSPKGYMRNIAIAEELLRHAEAMGALPPANPLEGIEDDIQLAKALNVRLKGSSPADGTSGRGAE